MITIESLMSVTVDGKPAGTVADALANLPSRRAEILDALIARESELSRSVDSKLAAIVAKYEAVIAALQDPLATKEDAQAELEKEANAREIEELTKARNAKAQEVADIEAKIQELGK